MLEQYDLKDILFFDIETVPQEKSFDDVNDSLKELWDKKSKYFRKEDESPADVYQRAGIYAEFGKIVCISVGFFDPFSQDKTLRIKSFYGKEESRILTDFKTLLEKYFYQPQHLLCAHNGKEFDFPYIARRMIINRIPLPEKLNLFGKKPWEVAHLDTLELWKFGDFKHYTSLNLLTEILGIASPKEDIDGSQVAQVYYEEDDLERIARYCENDTLAVAQVYLRLMGFEILNEDQVVRV